MNIILFESYPKDDRILLSDARGKHIKKILRLQEGDSFLMGLVNGFAGRAVVTRIDSEAVTIDWKPEISPVPLFPVILLVAQVRPICMKRILREAVSIGVERIVVSGTDTGERSYRDAKLWKDREYRMYILSGAQQAGRSVVPEVNLFNSLDAAAAGLKQEGTGLVRIVLDNINPETKLSTMQLPTGNKYILAVGPERGWSDRERKLFAKAGFLSAGLGDRILRTETACSAGLSLLLGRMSFM
ncbi:MAG: 16S rRNA (uracil(1498)-N(3))-methyltransferase [Bacteroidetes bacterium]|nr:16S rRNA (uracil(1498)-N(3))-methyltransferase [Bacteroidota bacterium]